MSQDYDSNTFNHITFVIRYADRKFNPAQLFFQNISTGKEWPAASYSTRQKAIELLDNRFNCLKATSALFRKFLEFDVDSDLGFFCDNCGDYEFTEHCIEFDGGATWCCRSCADKRHQEESDDDGVDWVGVDAAVFASQEARHTERNS
jgi:hypothetical protein